MEYSQLQHLEAVLFFHFHNLKLLHWNMCGLNFQSNHEYLDDVTDMMVDTIDKVTEMGMMNHVRPISYAEVLTIIGQDSVEHVSVNPELRRDDVPTFTDLITILKEVSSAMDACYDASAGLSRAQISEMESMQYQYDLRWKYLIPSRFITPNTAT